MSGACVAGCRGAAARTCLANFARLLMSTCDLAEISSASAIGVVSGGTWSMGPAALSMGQQPRGLLLSPVALLSKWLAIVMHVPAMFEPSEKCSSQSFQVGK